MADVFLTVNGIGHGHLMRALRISHWLRRAGRRPVVFHQGKYGADSALRVPGTSIPTHYEVPDEDAQRIVDEIAAVARLSQPALVIEDTHPVWLQFPGDITRILMVRPSVPEHMRALHDQYSPVFSRIIVCDHPDSPTWPYTEAETKEFLSREHWHAAEPIFRRHSAAGVARVKQRHRISPSDRVIVFSLGAGGEKQGTGDRMKFVEQAAGIAERLRSSSASLRLLFIGGPLFPGDLRIPPVFEVIKEEPDMPSLFAIAKAAVIRPGFNSIWECIAAQTPFFALPGTTYMEPTLERLEQLRRAGFKIPDAFPDSIDDSEWQHSFRLASERVLRRFSGSPKEQVVQLIQAAVSGQRAADAFAPLATPRHEITGNVPPAKSRRLTIRIDCVVDSSAALRWIAELCQARSLYASLEIIPYLSTLKAAVLDEIDPEQRLEVAQHGYAHLPAFDSNHRILGEFEHVHEFLSMVDKIQLRRGFRLLRYVFRERFKGGYSAPYERLPNWLPRYWNVIGGRHISVVQPRQIECEMPRIISCVKIGAKCEYSELTARILQCWETTGMANLAFDICELGSARQRSMMERVLDFAFAQGGEGARVSDQVGRLPGAFEPQSKTL